MKDNNLRLDGNAAGGLLNEIFPFEMTAAEATCGGCGTMRPIGELRGCYRLDLSGMSCLRIAADIH
jgi:hypothetical protein